MKTRFGWDIDEANNPLQDLINKDVKLGYIAAKIVLADAYDRMYKIFDHENFGDRKPMALVAKHPAEDVLTYSRAYNTIRRFIENDIGDVLNCSLQEFLSMPREYTHLVMDIITERRIRKNQVNADMEKRLKKDLEGGKY